MNKFYYHLAPQKYRSDIQNYGLDIEAIEVRNHNWCDKSIYVWDDLASAISWIDLRGFSDKPDLWKIDPQGIQNICEDYYRYERPEFDIYQHSYCVEMVEPQYLELIREEELQKLLNSDNSSHLNLSFSE